MAVPTHGDIQFKIRIPVQLKERIDSSARANSRSTTAEIVAVLEEKYPPPPPPDNDMQRLILLTRMIDAAMSDESAGIEVKRLHLTAARKVMRSLVDRMSKEEVDQALADWKMPPAFDLFD